VVDLFWHDKLESGALPWQWAFSGGGAVGALFNCQLACCTSAALYLIWVVFREFCVFAAFSRALQGLRALDRVFGSDTNSKGFKVIRGAGVIQVWGLCTLHLHRHMRRLW
jgi:hypothetical protein